MEGVSNFGAVAVDEMERYVNFMTEGEKGMLSNLWAWSFHRGCQMDSGREPMLEGGGIIAPQKEDDIFILESESIRQG